MLFQLVERRNQPLPGWRSHAVIIQVLRGKVALCRLYVRLSVENLLGKSQPLPDTYKSNPFLDNGLANFTTGEDLERKV